MNNRAININDYVITEDKYKELCNKYTKERVDNELIIEKDTQEESYNNTIAELSKENNRGQLKGSAVGIIRNSIPLMSHALRKYYDEANTGKPGKRHTLIAVLTQSAFSSSENKLDEDTLNQISYVVLKTIISNAVVTRTLCLPLVSLAENVGKNIESELKYNELKNRLNETNPRELQTAKVLVRSRVGVSFVKRFWETETKEYEEEIGNKIWNKWDKTKRVTFGLKLIELFIQSTGLGFLRKQKNNNKDIAYYFEAKECVLDYIDKNNEELAHLAFTYRPMSLPPLPWTTIDDGGYYINLKRKVPFIKKISKSDLKKYADIDMPQVYKAVNTIQNTAWIVNREVYAVASEISNWEHINPNLDMPSMYPSEKPIREPICDVDNEKHIEWRRSITRWYQAENLRKSKRLLINAYLSEAQRCIDYDELYFPHNIDFRGRIYPLPRFCPQGTDLCKALIKFKHGKPIGSIGKTWLAFHGANCFGLDKKPLKDRLEWVYSNSELILKTVENPYENTEWMEADSPWEFLAFCYEWKGVLEQGESYVCGLPIAFDGSCSGLQHFSAMLRDEVGGSAVNLIPSDSVQDIYKRVAEKVNEYLEVDKDDPAVDEIKTDEEGNEILIKSKGSLAREWLSYGVTRSVCKRPTMTLCYGAKKYGFTDQILVDIIKPETFRNPNTFSKPKQSARYMAELIWRALGEVVVTARAAMDWLQIASSLLARDKDEEGKSMPTYWVTPAGFPVYQKYMKETIKRICTTLQGGISIFDASGEETVLTEGTKIKPAVSIPTDLLDPAKQRNGIAPNFVHSMDACHMMMTVNKCHEKGIDSFACIHDSFGTVPADAQVLYETIREVFCDLYTNHDVLTDLHDHIASLLSPKLLEELPDVPMKGKLDINAVRSSLYAFS